MTISINGIPIDGSVIGPASTTVNAVARWGNTTGGQLKNSPVTVSDAGQIAGVALPTLAGMAMAVPPGVADGDMFVWSGGTLVRVQKGAANEAWLMDPTGTAPAWTTLPSSGGDVVGPGTSTPTAFSRFANGTGKLLADSGVVCDGSNNVSGMATLTLPNTGLHILDTNASHDLIIVPGSDLTADRNLTLTTGDAARAVTLASDADFAGTANTFGGGDGTKFTTRTATQTRTSLLTSPTGVGTLGERGAFTSGGLPASTADHILLVNSNTTDGSTSIVDTSPLAATITRAGSPLPVHGQERFFLGSTTLRFGGGYGTLPANAAYAIGTGDFCMRAWINRHAAEADRRILSMGQVTSNDGGWVWGVGSDATKMNFAVRSGGAITDYTTPAVDRYYRTGEWVQVELTRASGVLYFFVAGVLVYSTASVLSVGTAALTLYLGWSAHTSTAWNGWLQGVELLSVAGHTATYTP